MPDMRLSRRSEYGLRALVDLVRSDGIDAIAQVDLDRRVHRNHPVQKLGRMAFVIQHAILRRLRAEGRATFPDEPGRVLRQFRNVGTDYRVMSYELPLLDRPPLRTVNGPL